MSAEFDFPLDFMLHGYSLSSNQKFILQGHPRAKRIFYQQSLDKSIQTGSGRKY